MIDVKRTYLPTGAEFWDHVETIRDAETRVAWCGTDNLNMTRRVAGAAAAKAGEAFRRGEVFVLEGQYRFELVDCVVAS